MTARSSVPISFVDAAGGAIASPVVIVWRKSSMPDTTLDPVEFIDLAAQRRRIGARMDDAILRVVNHGKYIMGPEVGELERKLAEFCGVKHCIGVANGTDALLMA